ncbi:4-hydroxy-tetrahydrodipicolinate reductase [Parvularcula lutaonensis]|nr:4-hydroxy-tetrahydrodipicolinate reductase [Parvularcula lutaonensis]
MRIALLGGAGRMGRAIKALADCQDFPPREDGAADVLIDFSSPEGTAEAAAYCQEHGIPLVTGTTGLDDDQQAAVREASRHVPIVQSGNMSLGIALLQRLVAEAARSLEGFDIEILETHHRYKKDSPSGTALLLGEAAARARGTALSEAARFERHGRDDERRAEEIGFAVRRGGGVYGEHDVSFLGEGETVSLSHTALGRDAFARGALAAARWVIGKEPGLYGMGAVLGLDPER